jgi:hypothetical protein
MLRTCSHAFIGRGRDDKAAVCGGSVEMRPPSPFFYFFDFFSFN